MPISREIRVGGPKPVNRAQRLSIGREARGRVSRARLGEIETRKGGFDPIRLLLSADEGRLPKLLPLKYQRMSASPFAFFRGAVSIMAADLANQRNTGLTVQLCGDAHVQNLGCFEAPDGRLVFDINDFDETIAGPWEWDVKRMSASIVLAGFESGHNHSGCNCAVEIFAGTYAATIGELADQPILVAARHQIHRIKKAQPVSAAFLEARRADPLDLLRKYTEEGPRGRLQFKSVPKVRWRLSPKTRRPVLDALPLYRDSLPPERLHLFDFFRPLDTAFKIVGTGSVGLRDYVVLMGGNGKKDPLFLQLKQEVHSAYAPYLKHIVYEHQGVRVVEGQRKLQPISDLLLGWTRIGEHDYLVRQLNDHKGGVDLAQLRGDALNKLAAVAGELLARGHARSGDALAIASYLGTGDRVTRAIAKFATDYAALTETDFELFKKAIAAKKVSVAA